MEIGLFFSFSSFPPKPYLFFFLKKDQSKWSVYKIKIESVIKKQFLSLIDIVNPALAISKLGKKFRKVLTAEQQLTESNLN